MMDFVIKRRLIVVGKEQREQAVRNINLKLRGKRTPHRCTCAHDHGWH